MLKLLILLPVLCVAASLGLAVAASVVPLLFGLGVALCAVALAVAVFVLVIRIVAALVVGAGGLLCGVLGFMFFAVGCALLIGLFAALAHLLVPLLIIAAVVWFARHHARPVPVIRHA
jgi:hypothetical protein